jgi:uncharacterized protein YukE
MAQAVVDPEELRRFAQRLKKFNSELQNQSTLLGNQLATLGATWRDQEHKKFVEQFAQNMKVIARFTESTEQYIPYLLEHQPQRLGPLMRSHIELISVLL